jgi:hypothetical protein
MATLKLTRGAWTLWCLIVLANALPYVAAAPNAANELGGLTGARDEPPGKAIFHEM